MIPTSVQENAIAAIRISSLKQGLEGDSPEAQKEQIERFALMRNIKVKKFFIFMESASKEEQPVQEAIDYCKNPKNNIQLFIIKSIDRFTRGGSYLYDHLKMQLENHKVQLVDIYGIIGGKDVNTLEHLAHLVLKEIEHRGIKTADVLVRRIREDSVTIRQQQVETVRRRITQGVGLRVIVDGKLGFVHSSDVSEGALLSLVDRAIALAKETSSDPGHGIAEPSKAPSQVMLDIMDETISNLTIQEKIDQVMRLETAMLSADSRVARSIGADWHDSDDITVLMNTKGLSHREYSTGFALVGQAVAEQNGQMQRGFWWSQARHRRDLESPEEVGTETGKRAVALLGARSVPTTKVPVVFEAPIASQVLGVLFAAIDGEKIRKRSSYLVDRLDQQIASPIVTIIDDGHLPRKLGTQAVDDEGTLACRKILVNQGILKQYVYDVRGARLSNSTPTGNAHRSYGSLPSVGPTNLYLEPGSISKEDLIKSVEKGLFLTRIMGSGVNLVTGDVSWGGSGMWIEQGELAFPVEGITIAGNLLNLWCDIDMIANDLEWRSNVISPTFRVKEMMIGGK